MHAVKRFMILFLGDKVLVFGENLISPVTSVVLCVLFSTDSEEWLFIVIFIDFFVVDQMF